MNTIELLQRQGIMIEIGISFPRLNRKLTPEDLGLEESAIPQNLIVLGRKKLLGSQDVDTPERKGISYKLRLCESKRGALIRQFTRPFLGGVGNFCTNAAFPTLHQRIVGPVQDADDVCLRDLFEQGKQEFIDRYPEAREAAIEEWREFLARQNINGGILEKIIVALPSLHRLKFNFQYVPWEIKAPSSLEDGVVADPEVVAARKRAVQLAVEEVESGARQFATDSVALLRAEFAHTVKSVQDAISTSKVGVHQKTLNRIKDAYDRIIMLDIHNDEELRQLAEAAKNELLSKSAEEYRDSEYFKGQLMDGLAQLREATVALAQQDTTAVVDRWFQAGTRKISV